MYYVLPSKCKVGTLHQSVSGRYRYNKCTEGFQVVYCLSNCQEYIKAKAQNLISDKVCLDTTHQRFKVFNGYRLEAEATVILLFQNQTLVYNHHLDLKRMIRLTRLTTPMVSQKKISRYFSLDKNDYPEKIMWFEKSLKEIHLLLKKKVGLRLRWSSK